MQGCFGSSRKGRSPGDRSFRDWPLQPPRQRSGAPPRAAQAQAGDASAKVRATLETLVRDTPEIGLQVAAYLDGKLVVDAWAGMADEATKKPVDGDTMFMLSSTTKGVTATCMHACVEKHKLDYDMPIVKVWPEFGANGKGAATLRHALSHRTGVPQTPVGYTPDWLPDWDRMCRGIAELEADVSHQRADRLPFAQLRIHQWRDPASCRWPQHRPVPAGRDLQAARHQRRVPGGARQRVAPGGCPHGRASGAGRLRCPNGRRTGWLLSSPRSSTVQRSRRPPFPGLAAS